MTRAADSPAGDGGARRAPGFDYEFRCRRSGNCCAIPGGFVRLCAGDIERIAAHLGLAPAAFASRYLQPDGSTLKDGLGNRCVFLRDGAVAGCEVYSVRPERCRQWPFWPEVLHDARLRDLVVRTCPGITPLPASDAPPR